MLKSVKVPPVLFTNKIFLLENAQIELQNYVSKYTPFTQFSI